MQVKCKHNRVTEYILTDQEAQDLFRADKLRGATVHETIGPHWKNIYWSPAQRPYVMK